MKGRRRFALLDFCYFVLDFLSLNLVFISCCLNQNKNENERESENKLIGFILYWYRVFFFDFFHSL